MGKIIGFLLILVLLSLVSKLIGAGLIVGGIGYGIYLLFNRHKLSSYTKKRKIISITAIVFALIIGSSLITTPSTTEISDSEVSSIEQLENVSIKEDQLINESNSVVEASTKDIEVVQVSKEEEKAANQTEIIPAVNGNLEVHFIDVGQADSILIKAPSGENMLIDAGNNADSNLVQTYLKNQGVNTVDVLVGTHPHEDHIGSLDTVINNFNIGKIYMPKITHTTKTFEDVILAIKNKEMRITSPVAGETFNLGSATFTILGPNSSSYEGLNNYSIVLKMNYGNTSFLFTGDAEGACENEIVNKGFNLAADVLKVGHHGSDSSTTQSFLDKVSPKYAVIMVGSGNSYGHPTSTVLDRLKAKEILVYRTDENGNIVATSDGTNITFNTTPGTYASAKSSTGSTESNSGSVNSSPAPAPTPTPAVVNPASPTADRTVYWTPNGKSYHYTDQCSTLSRSKTILSGPFSQNSKSDPCDRCVK